MQDKVWVSGPGGEPWEVYTVLADVGAELEGITRHGEVVPRTGRMTCPGQQQPGSQHSSISSQRSYILFTSSPVAQERAAQPAQHAPADAVCSSWMRATLADLDAELRGLRHASDARNAHAAADHAARAAAQLRG